MFEKECRPGVDSRCLFWAVEHSQMLWNIDPNSIALINYDLSLPPPPPRILRNTLVTTCAIADNQRLCWNIPQVQTSRPEDVRLLPLLQAHGRSPSHAHAASLISTRDLLYLLLDLTTSARSNPASSSLLLHAPHIPIICQGISGRRIPNRF
jgi:hypothetical protein